MTEEERYRLALEEELRDILDQPDVNPVWAALHIGSSAIAVGISDLRPAPPAKR